MDAAVAPRAADAAVGTTVRHLRHVLLWPLRVLPPAGDDGGGERAPWLRLSGAGSPWQPVVDEYTGDREGFHERHYNEFVSFLPYVQRFLYGEGRRGRAGPQSATSMQVFRRHDVAAARVVPRAGDPPVTLQVVHVDLYFFYDVDVVLLNVEVAADGLPLPLAHEVLYRFGRGYPPGWDRDGEPLHCMAAFDWLDAAGRVLASSDASERDAFLAHVAEHRAPRISAHWAWLLAPLVADHSGAEGPLRFRQIEYHRMPMMAYLAVDDPRGLARADFVRLALVTGAGEAPVPEGELHGDDFERRHCYDRFWCGGGAAPYTRYLCCGHALVVVGAGGSEFFRCGDRGVLAQFRHQHFLLFLIVHFQKAALLSFSDRLVEALNPLDVSDADSVKRFKRTIRGAFEGFLRFTHRYWFREVSEQAHVRALFRMCAAQLGTEALFAEVKQRIADMSSYLDADSLRRQANTVVRLTVVTIFGLIGTITTGFLGMNLLAEAEAPLARRLAWFALVMAATLALTFYTVARSKRLSDFLDAVSDERLSWRAKVAALAAVWRRRPPG